VTVSGASRPFAAGIGEGRLPDQKAGGEPARWQLINKPYLFDYIECIFHPIGARAGYSRLSTA
jgi:hypothetical protein